MPCEGTGEAPFTSCAYVLEFLPPACIITKLTFARPESENALCCHSEVFVKETLSEFEAQTGTVVVSVLCQTSKPHGP